MKYLAVIGYIISQENKEYIVHTKRSTEIGQITNRSSSTLKDIINFFKTRFPFLGIYIFFLFFIIIKFCRTSILPCYIHCDSWSCFWGNWTNPAKAGPCPSPDLDTNFSSEQVQFTIYYLITLTCECDIFIPSIYREKYQS